MDRWLEIVTEHGRAALALGLLLLLPGAPATAQTELVHRADYFDDDASGGSPPRVPTPGVYGVNGNSDVVVTSDGRFLYAAGKTDDAVAIFSRDLDDGSLAPLGCWADPAGEALAPGDPEPCGSSTAMLRPISLALSPDDAHLYVASDDSAGVTGFARNATTGDLTPIGTAPLSVDPVFLDKPFSVVVSPDGNHVYAAGFFSNTIAIFSRDTTTGVLTELQALLISNIVVDPDTEPPTTLAGTAVNDIAISPDGTRIYATLSVPPTPSLSSLLVILRDPGTGGLLPAQVEFNGFLGPVGNQSGIGGIRQVAVSPDGNHVYVTGALDDSVALFVLDAQTGLLNYGGAIGGGDDMDGAHGVGVSSDGLRVYVLSKGGVFHNALNVFERNPATGGLSLLEVHRNNSGGIQGFAQPNAVTTSPDSLDVYVAGERADAVVHLPEAAAGLAQALVIGGLFALRRLRAQIG